jgi:hypothetical protein
MVSRLAPCPGKHDSDASDNDRDEDVQDWDYFVRTHTRTVSATSDDDVTRGEQRGPLTQFKNLGQRPCAAFNVTSPHLRRRTRAQATSGLEKVRCRVPAR